MYSNSISSVPRADRSAMDRLSSVICGLDACLSMHAAAPRRAHMRMHAGWPAAGWLLPAGWLAVIFSQI